MFIASVDVKNNRRILQFLHQNVQWILAAGRRTQANGVINQNAATVCST